MESVFAKNRNAIVDIHMLDSQGHRQTSSASSEGGVKLGDHHCKLSISTGVECPPIPDVNWHPERAAARTDTLIGSPSSAYLK